MGFMSFRSKRTGSFRFRDNDSQGDALFESDLDELVIRFDPESRSYRVMKASETHADDAGDNEDRVESAKVLAADV